MVRSRCGPVDSAFAAFRGLLPRRAGFDGRDRASSRRCLCPHGRDEQPADDSVAVVTGPHAQYRGLSAGSSDRSPDSVARDDRRTDRRRVGCHRTCAPPRRRLAVDQAAFHAPVPALLSDILDDEDIQPGASRERIYSPAERTDRRLPTVSTTSSGTRVRS